MNVYPGLNARPFHDPRLFPLARPRNRIDPIRSVIARLAEAVFASELESHLMESGAWDVFMLKSAAEKTRATVRYVRPLAQVA